MSEPLPVRHAARAVVLDSFDRILLFHGELRERPPRWAWYLPGGRVEDGETHEVAVVRELREEIGLRDVNLGPCVWTRRSMRVTATGMVDSHSRFFLVRCPCFEVDTSDAGVESAIEWRWWTSDELRATSDPSFIPDQLPELVAALLDGDVPSSPIDTSV